MIYSRLFFEYIYGCACYFFTDNSFIKCVLINYSTSRTVNNSNMVFHHCKRVFIDQDRKSTRLNSSHVAISYAVFCLTLSPPRSPLFPYTTLFRSLDQVQVIYDLQQALLRIHLWLRLLLFH